MVRAAGHRPEVCAVWWPVIGRSADADESSSVRRPALGQPMTGRGTTTRHGSQQHFSTIATSHWLPPWASRYTPPPGPNSPFVSNPLSLPPTTLCPRLPPPLFPPSSRPGLSVPFQSHSLSTTPSISVPHPPSTLVPMALPTNQFHDPIQLRAPMAHPYKSFACCALGHMSPLSILFIALRGKAIAPCFRHCVSEVFAPIDISLSDTVKFLGCKEISKVNTWRLGGSFKSNFN